MDANKVVYGAAKISTLVNSNVYKILTKLYENDITEIDTAPSYDDSEKRLGELINDFSRFKINSKVGLNLEGKFDCTTIRESVYNSIDNLNIDSLNVLFIHSVPYELLTAPAFEALKQLKAEGLFRELGYSGDGSDLSAVIANNSEDLQSLMFSYNFLDQSNLDTLNNKKIGQNLYVKRVLANGVWRKRTSRDVMKDLLGLTRGHDEYRRRLRHLYPHGIKNGYSLSIDFVQKNIPEAKYLIGITSIEQCDELLSYLAEPELVESTINGEMSKRYREHALNSTFNPVT